MSEEDVQFYYQATISPENFIQISLTNDLKIGYASFLHTFKQLCQDVLRSPKTHKIIFVLDNDDGNAELKFRLYHEMKKCDLLKLDSFRQLDDEKINMHVSFRIESLKKKKDLISNRLREVLKILHENNPKLVEYIEREIRGV